MKKWNYIRTVLSNVGYTTNESMEGLIVHYLDSEAYLYFTDAGGNKFKAKWNSPYPILIDSDTIIITVETLNDMNVGDTQQIIVKNEDNISVIDECSFSVPTEFEDFLSVSSTGIITALQTKNNLYINIQHNDFDPMINPGASGTTINFNIL